MSDTEELANALNEMTASSPDEDEQLEVTIQENNQETSGSIPESSEDYVSTSQTEIEMQLLQAALNIMLSEDNKEKTLETIYETMNTDSEIAENLSILGDALTIEEFLSDIADGTRLLDDNSTLESKKILVEGMIDSLESYNSHIVESEELIEEIFLPEESRLKLFSTS